MEKNIIASNNNTNMAQSSCNKSTSDLKDMLPNGKEHTHVEEMFAKLSATQAAKTSASAQTTKPKKTKTPPPPPPQVTPAQAPVTQAQVTQHQPPPPVTHAPVTQTTTKHHKLDKRAALALCIDNIFAVSPLELPNQGALWTLTVNYLQTK